MESELMYGDKGEVPGRLLVVIVGCRVGLSLVGVVCCLLFIIGFLNAD